MIDFESLALSQIFGHLSYPATLTIKREDFDIMALDHTRGVSIGEDITVSTIVPAIGIKLSDLDALELTVSDILGGTVTFKGVEYLVRDTKEEPIPGGRGQLYLFLKAKK